jgi:hypothetical protein
VVVSLSRGGHRVAIEISVSTTRDQELGNVEKCLAAAYDEVILVGRSARHVETLSRFVGGALDEGVRQKVRYLVPESVVEYLQSLPIAPETTEATVRGYRVKTVRQATDPAEAAKRRAAIAGVIARSLGHGKKK